MNPASHAMLSIYCERAGNPGLAAEPLNAITNLAFVVAGLLLTAKMVRQKGVQWQRGYLDLYVLIALLIGIGVGSGLWHTHVDIWTLLADVIPIYLFINLYIFSVFRRLIGWLWWQVALCWVGYCVLTALVAIFVKGLAGSEMYLPPLLMLLFAGGMARSTDSASSGKLFITALLFALSLSLRTVDSYICETIPMGSHFLWHLLNAWVLYRLVAVY